MSAAAPLVSVVVPVYRIPRPALEQCIQSVLAQTMADWELLLIDDGSPDDCGRVCDEWAAKDPRIHAVHQANAGVSAARNRGVEQAAGRWLTFVDADDWIDPEMLEQLLENAERADAEIALCDMQIEYGKQVLANRFFAPDRLLLSEAGRDRFQLEFLCGRVFGDGQGNTDGGGPVCKLYSMELLRRENIRFVPGLMRFEDNVFNLYAYEKAREIVYFARPLYHYCKREDSACNGFDPQTADRLEAAWQQMERFCEHFQKPTLYRQALAVKIVHCFFTVLKLQCFHPQNPQRFGQKLAGARALAASPRYAGAARQAPTRYLSLSEKIFCFLLRHRLVLGLWALKTAKDIVWKLRGLNPE